MSCSLESTTRKKDEKTIKLGPLEFNIRTKLSYTVSTLPDKAFYDAKDQLQTLRDILASSDFAKLEQTDRELITSYINSMTDGIKVWGPTRPFTLS